MEAQPTPTVPPPFSTRTRPRREIEAVVVLMRLELYNRGRPCGPKALRHCLAEYLPPASLPSERTIARILAGCGLTHGRTGWYPHDPR